MRSNLPPIVTTARRLMLEIEQTVPHFPQRHKFLLGQDIRADVTAAALLSQQGYASAADKPRQAVLVASLVETVDRLKLRLQTAQLLQLFPSFPRFDEVIRIADELGRQSGGWHKKTKQHLIGQNPAATAPAGASRDTEYPHRPAGANT